MTLLFILLFTFFGSIISVILAGIFFLRKKKINPSLLEGMIAYAAGTLLSVSLLGLLPHALEDAGEKNFVFQVFLGGIIFFFFLEKLIVWRHCHRHDCETHNVSGAMILIGDAFHNFTDGIIIAAAFLVSFPLGIIVGLSTIAHEIPQELGDFGILLHSGYKKTKALFLNLLSGLSSFMGAFLAYFMLSRLVAFLPYIMVFSASSFIYIALSDLAPELHRQRGAHNILRQLILFCLGVLTIILMMKLHRD